MNTRQGRISHRALDAASLGCCGILTVIALSDGEHGLIEASPDVTNRCSAPVEKNVLGEAAVAVSTARSAAAGSSL